MRVAMRSLLSRKSHKGLNEREQESESSNHKPNTFLPPLDNIGERVFPIRNLQDNSELPWLPSNGYGSNGQNGNSKPPAGKNLEYTSPSRSPMNGNGSMNGRSGPQVFESKESTSDAGSEQRQVSERSQLVMLKSGQPQLLVDNNQKTTFQRCEDEPIHIPGAVQSFGALLGMKYTQDGRLEVRIASENTRKILGYGPEQLFALPSFLDVLKDDVRKEMQARIRQALDNADELKHETRLDIFQITLTFPYEPETRLWCALHVSQKSDKMIVCEFEEYVDAFYLKDLRAARVLPDLPVRSAAFDSTPEDLRLSTTSHSKPLPVLQIARQRKHKEFSSLDLFNALAQAQKQITNCVDVQAVLDVAVGIISELTGFHRVMFYRFDAKKNGRVDAELVNPQASTDSYRGLHFPESDIPKQARNLYKINRIRILHDRDADTARLVCRHESDFAQPLDLTHAYLRAMSPIHNQYLANMGVRSTMSISVVVGDDLWGLIACHGYGEAGIRVSLPIRELCRNIGDCIAVKIQQLSMQQRIEARRPPAQIPSAKNPAGLLATTSADLLNLVDADFALLSVDGEARAIGRLDPYQEAVAIMSYLQSCQFTEIKSSQNINTDFPEIKCASGIKQIAGILLIPLNGGGANDFLVFFRKSQLKHIKWAGNPYEKIDRHIGYLEPRSSFQRWVETIDGSSKEWTEDQMDIGWVLSLLYSRLIEIWRQKGSGNQGDVIQSIRASSRELRTPINAVNNYIEMAIENANDDKTRQILARAQEASSSIADVMEDLMRLTKPEDSPSQRKIEDENFNLSATVSRVMKALQKEAQRKYLELGFSIHDQLPTLVKGDGDRFKQILAYLTSNAFSRSTSALVEINVISTKDTATTIGISVQDAGPGMSETELDDTFQEFEQAQEDNDWLFATNDTGTKQQEKSPLAIIAKYVRQIDGQIRLSSEPGKGTVFTLELPFEHAQTSDALVPRKLRNLFSSNSSSQPQRFDTAKFPLPPANNSPPSIRSSKLQKEYLNGSLTRKLDAMIPTPVTDHLSPRTSTNGNGNGHALGTDHLSPRTSSLNKSDHILGADHLSPRTSTNGNGHVVGVQFRDRPPSPYRPKTTSPPPTSMPDLENEDRASFVGMHVLIAEDNFVSQRLLEKRLSQLGYTVTCAGDGQECHDKFVTASAGGKGVDVILMDMKMPLVDGTLSARMIRFWEKESQHRASMATSDDRSTQSAPKQRVPIIAVTAELNEDSRFEYIQSGFDGWASKPLDLRKLDLMLQSVKDVGMKRDSLYSPGQEGGGWFFP